MTNTLMEESLKYSAMWFVCAYFRFEKGYPVRQDFCERSKHHHDWWITCEHFSNPKTSLYSK